MLLNLFVISIIYTPCSAALPNPTGDLFIAEYKKWTSHNFTKCSKNTWASSAICNEKKLSRNQA